MSDFNEFKFNRLEERAWELERKLKENENTIEAIDEDKQPAPDPNQWDNEMCRKCMSGEMEIFCEVCRKY